MPRLLRAAIIAIMQSIFIDKESKPGGKDLLAALGNAHDLWLDLADFTKKNYPAAFEEWKFTGAKYGWNYRISDKKRVLIYLLPRNKFFKAAFVFGQKATGEILRSNISIGIKTELKNAKIYAEGRGIRIEVKDNSIMNDLKELIKIKISN